MSQYRKDFGNPIRHGFVLVAILLLHLLAIGALWSGLRPSRVRYVQTIFQIEAVPADKPKESPRRIPVNLTESWAIQIVTPEIDIPVAEDLPPPIQVTRAVEEFAASPGPPAVAAALSDPDIRPRPIHVPGGRNRYPAESVRAGEFGAPTITICISATGAVDSVQVNESSGFPRLDQAAVSIGKEAIFRPARLDGKPVPFCLPYRIKFKIGNS
jgi:periplasmic protein TonB